MGRLFRKPRVGQRITDWAYFALTRNETDVHLDILLDSLYLVCEIKCGAHTLYTTQVLLLLTLGV